MRSQYERVMAKTRRDDATGCLLFLGSKDGGGYGKVSTRHGQAPAKAHRVVFEHHFGAVPPGLYVCHSCDTPSCVEIGHLRADTPRENALDVERRARRNPRSLQNLQPGRRGFYGAAPRNAQEASNVARS